MSHRRELALAALLAVAVAVAVLAGRGRSPSRESAFERRTSAFLAGPRGSKATYDVLARLGVPVERRRRPLFGLAREGARRPGLLVVRHPPVDLQAAEIAEVVRYVRGGGAVLAAGDGGGIAACAGWIATRAGQGLRDSLPVVPRGLELRLPAVASVLKPVAREKTPPPDASCPLLVASRADTLLAGRDGRPVVLRLRYPRGGQVTLAADPGYFRNVVWRQTGVAAFAMPLFLAGRRGAIVWDEYHQRFGRGGSLTAATLAWLAGAPAGWAMLQLAAVLLVALAVAAVRFGPARRVIDVRRRSPLEQDRKSTRLNSSHLVISYAVFCLKKKNAIATAGWGAYVGTSIDRPTPRVHYSPGLIQSDVLWVTSQHPLLRLLCRHTPSGPCPAA